MLKCSTIFYRPAIHRLSLTGTQLGKCSQLKEETDQIVYMNNASYVGDRALNVNPMSLSLAASK